jgi:hypothetical protein
MTDAWVLPLIALEDPGKPDSSLLRRPGSGPNDNRDACERQTRCTARHCPIDRAAARVTGPLLPRRGCSGRECGNRLTALTIFVVGMIGLGIFARILADFASMWQSAWFPPTGPDLPALSHRVHGFASGAPRRSIDASGPLRNAVFSSSIRARRQQSVAGLGRPCPTAPATAADSAGHWLGRPTGGPNRRCLGRTQIEVTASVPRALLLVALGSCVTGGNRVDLTFGHPRPSLLAKPGGRDIIFAAAPGRKRF